MEKEKTMNELDLLVMAEYVNTSIDVFHSSRINIISSLQLRNLISKNPYLFRAKNITKASELIEGTLEAFLSSSEEKLFGDFLEDLALYVATITTNGRKSSAPGIDIEFEDEGITNIISVKSGPNWGNSSQLKKLADDFHKAEIRLRQSSQTKNVRKVLGICYGKTKTSSMKAGYIKIVGQNFWSFISDNKELYIKIIEPVGHSAKEHNDKYEIEKAKIINTLTKKFIDGFCKPDGEIDWEKLLIANSGNYDLDEFFGG